MKDLLASLFLTFSSLALMMLKIPVTSHGSERKYVMCFDYLVVYFRGTTGEKCLGASAGLKCCTRSQREIDLKDAVNGFTSLIDYPAELPLPKSCKVQVCTKGFPFRYSDCTICRHSALIRTFIFIGKIQGAGWWSFVFLRFWWSEILRILEYPGSVCANPQILECCDGSTLYFSVTVFQSTVAVELLGFIQHTSEIWTKLCFTTTSKLNGKAGWFCLPLQPSDFLLLQESTAVIWTCVVTGCSAMRSWCNLLHPCL